MRFLSLLPLAYNPTKQAINTKIRQPKDRIGVALLFARIVKDSPKAIAARRRQMRVRIDSDIYIKEEHRITVLFYLRIQQFLRR